MNFHEGCSYEDTVFCPGLKKGMVLLEEKGHFCSRNYILRALSHARNYFLRAHCTNSGQHILCLKCNIRGHSSVT